MGLFSNNTYFLLSAILLLTIINYKYNFSYWWCLLLFFAGIYSSHLQTNKNLFWEEENKNYGYSEYYFEWAGDPNVKESHLEGWAWVMPLSKNTIHKDLKKKQWVNAKVIGDVPFYTSAKFARWTSKVANNPNQNNFKMKCLIQQNILSISSVGYLRAYTMNYCRKIWNKNYSSEVSSFLQSMTFSNRSELSAKEKNSFARLGLLPLLALSGLHVGIIFVCFRRLFKIITVRENIINLLALTTVILYGLLGGMGYSLKRAIFMCALFVLSRLLAKRYNLLNSLCIVALFEIILYPDIIYSIAFQLSYTGVAGIAWAFKIKSFFVKRTFKKGYPLLDLTIDSYIVSWGAMLFTWPICAYYFKTVPVYSWILSIPFTLLFTIVVYNVLVVFFCTILFGISSHFLIYPIEWFLSSVLFFSNHFAWINAWNNINIQYLVWYYIGLVGISIALSQRNHIYHSHQRLALNQASTIHDKNSQN